MNIDWKTFNTVRQKPQYKFTKVQKQLPLKMTRVPFESLPTLLYLDVEPYGRMSHQSLPYIKELSFILVHDGVIIKEGTHYRTRPSIDALVNVMNEHSPVLVAHNGVSYDFPIIIAHAAHYGLLESFQRVQYADTFVSAKRSPLIQRGYSNSAVYEQVYGAKQPHGKLHQSRVDVIVLFSWVTVSKLPMYLYSFQQLVAHQLRTQFKPARTAKS